MKRICVVSVGYVGLVTAACFGDLGDQVIALDVKEICIENRNKGIITINVPVEMRALGISYRGVDCGFDWK